MDSKRIITVCVTALVLILLIAYMVVPIFSGLETDSRPVVGLQPGDEWEYTVETSIPAVITIDGPAASWLTVDGYKIYGTVPSNPGSAVLNITATSVHPSQTATQSIVIKYTTAEVVDPMTALVWLIPALMALGAAIYALRGMLDMDKDDEEKHTIRFSRRRSR